MKVFVFDEDSCATCAAVQRGEPVMMSRTSFCKVSLERRIFFTLLACSNLDVLGFAKSKGRRCARNATVGPASRTPGLKQDDVMKRCEKQLRMTDGFELLDGMIYALAPEGKSHKLTRLRIDTYLHGVVDLTKYTVGTEASSPAPGWKEGPN